MENSDKNTFYLGFTMGGAVSAGAYTGGVMDYFFQALDNWEKAKKGELPNVNPDLVPKHQVIIDAMGGTSAGGMATVMSALYGLQKERNPIIGDKVNQIRKRHGNVFYDSWVMLSEQENGGDLVLDQALSTSDLDDGKIESLINSEFIDSIAKNAFNTDRSTDDEPDKYIPPYLSKKLELLLSHTMLRGIPLEVSFANGNINTAFGENPSHVSYEHFIFSHFKLSKNKDENLKKYLALNPYNPEHRKRLLDATIATGAFPLGLRYRQFENDHFNSDYIKSVISRLITGDIGKETPKISGEIDWESEPLKSIINEYSSFTIDGGAINNEPYFEIYKILEERHGAPSYVHENKEYHKYGVVMIDPFPDFPDKDTQYKPPSKFGAVLWKIIQTLWDQSKVKRREMVEQFAENKSFRGYIYPSKYRKGKKGWEKMDTPIASASLGAFGGFLDIRFRHHDFHLGRNNARNYIRAFLSLPYDPENGIVHPIHEDWSDEMITRFKVTLGKDKVDYLPIIPDMDLIRTDIDIRPTWEEALNYSVPEMPKMSSASIKKYKPKIRKRVRRMVWIVLAQLWRFVHKSLFGKNDAKDKKCVKKKTEGNTLIAVLKFILMIVLLLPTLAILILSSPLFVAIYFLTLWLSSKTIISIIEEDLCKKELLAT